MNIGNEKLSFSLNKVFTPLQTETQSFFTCNNNFYFEMNKSLLVCSHIHGIYRGMC